MKIFLIFLVAAIASATSFIIHVISAQWLPSWIGSQMQGILIQPSWDVRYIAGATSIEYGFAAVALYFLARDKLAKVGRFKSSIIFSILLASIHGAFIRQPCMDFVVGNPIQVVLVQNGFKWLIWISMAFVVVYGYEWLLKLSAKQPRKKEET